MNNFIEEIEKGVAEHGDELPFDNPVAGQTVGYIEITPPVDMSSLKADKPLELKMEESEKEDSTPDEKPDEKEKPAKKKSVKAQLSDKKEKSEKTAKPKKIDTKDLGEAI